MYRLKTHLGNRNSIGRTLLTISTSVIFVLFTFLACQGPAGEDEARANAAYRDPRVRLVLAVFPDISDQEDLKACLASHHQILKISSAICAMQWPL